jgi:hypothetical protein
VFAHGYTVGQAPGQSYRYWEDRWNKDAGAGRDGFWYPPSPTARYSIRQGLQSNQGIIGKILTALSTPLLAPLALAEDTGPCRRPQALERPDPRAGAAESVPAASLSLWSDHRPIRRRA